MISTGPVDNRIRVLFALEDLLGLGINIEYWNVSKFTVQELGNSVYIKDLAIYSINDIQEFEDKIKEQKRSGVLYITYMNYFSKTFSCYKKLTKYDCKILYCVNGCLPELDYKKRFNSISFKKIWNSVIEKIYSSLFLSNIIKCADYELLTCGKASLVYKTNSNTIVKRYNSTDYEIFCNESLEPICSDKYIVFIDQYYPYHRDIALHGWKYINSDRYFSLLNDSFSQIENLYGCKVVIAAHPASELYKVKNPFDKRMIYFGVTNNLIRYSVAVIAHNSTAISFAVLNNKKLMLLTSNEIVTNYSTFHYMMVKYKTILDCPMYNMDHIKVDYSFKNIATSKYNQYKYDYLTNKETEKYSNLEILLSLLK